MNHADDTRNTHHRIHRHPAAPWAELRTSVLSTDGYRPHSHAEYSIGIVDQGEAIFHHPDGPERLRPGAVVLIEPHVTHACNPSTRPNWSYRMLFVQADWLHQHITPLLRMGSGAAPVQALRFHARASHDGQVHEAADRVCRPINDASDAEPLSQALLQLVARHAAPAAPADGLPLAPSLQPALAHMLTGLDCLPTVQALAQTCGMSSVTFIRHFKKAVGITPGEHLRNLRINGARRLIAQGASLAEAAYAMGFADQAHLQRVFKSHHAMTPGQYAGAPAQQAHVNTTGHRCG